jgi:hypothetical protein
MSKSNPYTGKELKHFSNMRVAILAPMMYIEPDWVQSVCDMISYSWNYGLRVEKFAKTWRTVIDWARDDLVRSGLNNPSPFSGKPFTHFLWLDSDHIFKPDLCCQLARHDLEAVSALYYHRKGAPTPVVFTRNEKDPTGYKHFTLLEIPPVLVQVDAFGFGACLIKREVFEKVPEPWFCITSESGEDIAFARKAREHGIKFWLDGAYIIAHIGDPPIIGHNTYKQWYAENQNRLEDYRIPIDLTSIGGKEDDRSNPDGG